MTHDSIGLGEDGPTHQPIEHLASFRAMPNMLMVRPSGGNETAGAYKVAVSNRQRPTTIALSRQGMPNLPGCSAEGVEKGAYVVHGGDAKPDVIIIGTGSELPMAVDAAKKIEADGKKVGWCTGCIHVTLPMIWHMSNLPNNVLQGLPASSSSGLSCMLNRLSTN